MKSIPLHLSDPLRMLALPNKVSSPTPCRIPKCLSWVTAPFLMAPWIHHGILWALPVQSCTLQKNAKSVLGLRPTTAILQESTRRRVSSHHRLAFRGRQPAVSNEPQFKLMVESEVETTFSAYLHKILSRPKHA